MRKKNTYLWPRGHWQCLLCLWFSSLTSPVLFLLLVSPHSHCLSSTLIWSLLSCWYLKIFLLEWETGIRKKKTYLSGVGFLLIVSSLSLSQFLPISTSQAVAHGSSWGCCCGGGLCSGLCSGHCWWYVNMLWILSSSLGSPICTLVPCLNNIHSVNMPTLSSMHLKTSLGLFPLLGPCHCPLICPALDQPFQWVLTEWASSLYLENR